jgi:hypothetical protein
MIIEVAERDGIYKVSHNGRPLCDSPCPPLDGARLLLAQGYDPDATVVMRRAGSDMEALRGRLGTVANLRIGGDGVGFRRGRQPVQASPMRFGAEAA